LQHLTHFSMRPGQWCKDRIIDYCFVMPLWLLMLDASVRATAMSPS